MKRAGRAIAIVGTVIALAVVFLLVRSQVRDREAALAGAEAELATNAAREIALTGSLPDRLAETSGVAASRRQDGVLWTHNDSGDEPRVHAVSLDGTLLGTWTLPGAQAHDWEDIALAACPGRLDACLYVGDVGDNAETRASVALYIVPEPDVRPGDHATAAPTRIDFDYPDRSHDVEALAVAPDGAVVLITKGRDGSIHVFRIPPAQLAASGRVTAVAADTLPLRPWAGIGRQVTGAAFSPDGSLLAVRTYTEVRFFRTVAGGFEEVAPGCALGRAEPQGEAIDFLDPHTLVLTSEARGGQPAGIRRVRCALLERR